MRLCPSRAAAALIVRPGHLRDTAEVGRNARDRTVLLVVENPRSRGEIDTVGATTSASVTASTLLD